MEHEHEEVEQIPWAMLADQLEGGRRRSLGMLALAVAAAVIVAVVALNVLRRPSGTTVEIVPGTTEVAAAAAAPTLPEPPADASPADAAATEPTPTALPAPGLYSEADLMAVAPEHDLRLVAARAEWFVSDYFTVLGADDPVDGLADAVPRPSADDVGCSCVEWVRTMTVTPLGPDEYEAAVLYRTLRRDDAGDLVRTPVRAVSLRIVVDPEGGLGVAGLPRPVAVPPLAATSVELVTPPAGVAAAALTEVAGLGTEPEVIGGVAGEVSWRVVVVLTDVSGIRWPYEVTVPNATSGPES